MYDFLIDNKLVHVKIDKDFRELIHDKVIEKYGSLKEYNDKKLKIKYVTLKYQFNRSVYFKFDRLLRIAEDIDISKEEVFNHISAFFAYGSNKSKEVIIPKEITIDEQFVEGFALYLAEGDTGLSGNTKPRKFRFTNSEICVINHMVKWINKYLPENEFYLLTINPTLKNYNKITKYRLCLDSAIIIDLILAMDIRIKNICSNDEGLAAAYIRGMMIGEGTAYFNKSRYVRIEMKNEREIKYLHMLFTCLGFDCNPSLRTTRHNMWSLYIGAKQLRRYNDLIGLGVHEKRQAILEKAVNKKLRVNQYC